MTIDVEKLNEEITLLRSSHRQMNTALLKICNSQITDSVTLVKIHNSLDQFEKDLNTFCTFCEEAIKLLKLKD